MYISGAKFKNTALILLEIFLIECCTLNSGTTYDVITFLICIIQKREYLYNEKRYSKKENAILLNFKKPFK